MTASFPSALVKISLSCESDVIVVIDIVPQEPQESRKQKAVSVVETRMRKRRARGRVDRAPGSITTVHVTGVVDWDKHDHTRPRTHILTRE